MVRWAVRFIRRFYRHGFTTPLIRDGWFQFALVLSAVGAVSAYLFQRGIAASVGILVFCPWWIGFIREIALAFRAGWRNDDTSAHRVS